MKQFGLTPEASEEIAIKALTFLSNDAELMGRFLSLSGLDPAQLRAVIGEPSFLAGLLDFMMTDDALLLSFVSNHALSPEDVIKAKQVLDPMGNASTGAL